MTEDKSRFRIKKGDIEIEYEGKSAEVTAKYEEAFKWIREVAPPKQLEKRKKVKEKKEKEKPERRGGLRRGALSREIDNLIEEGWLDDLKRVSEVHAELKRRAVSTSGQAVSTALRRRVGKTLERKKDTEGKWTYHKTD